MPKPDSLEIGTRKITCWFNDMQQAGVFFTNAIAVVNQKMPKVRYLAPFTVSLLTERTGDRLSYNDDVNPKNDWPRYIWTPKEAEIFITGNAQRKFQKLDAEISALLENIQGNKSFPTCRFWPNEACVLGTKCCLQFYHDLKRPARSVRHREESDTVDRNALGMANLWLNKSAPPPYVVYTSLCRHVTIDTGRSCVNQPTHHTIQEDPVEGGAAARDRLQFVEEAGAAQDIAERDLAVEWEAPTTAQDVAERDLAAEWAAPLRETPRIRIVCLGLSPPPTPYALTILSQRTCRTQFQDKHTPN